MPDKEWFPLIGTAVAAAFGFLARRDSTKSRRIASTGPENAVLNQLTACAQRFLAIEQKLDGIESRMKAAYLTAGGWRKWQQAVKEYRLESQTWFTYLNSACRQYLDGGLDPKWFRGMFEADVWRVVKTPAEGDEKWFGGAVTEYGAILDVYRKWFTQE